MPEFGLMDSFKQDKLPSGWLNKFMRFGAILLVIVLILYFALNYGYLRFLDKKVAGVENKIQALEQEIASQDREEVSLFYSQLINLRNLLSNHIYASQVFNRLELITHPQVFFNNFNYDFNESRLKMDGYSATLPAIAEQLLAFQRTSDFQKVGISDIRQISRGRVSFSLEIFFKSGLVLNKI